MNRTIYLILCAVLTLAPSLTPAVTGRILEDNEVPQADEAALTSEAEVFKTIGMGIAISLAQCEEQSVCTPNISNDELAHLLETLDKRINDLVARQERQQGDYTSVLTAYVNQRETYLRYQADLKKLTGSSGETTATADETTPADTAAVESPPTTTVEKETGGSEVDLDVFSDVEEELE